MRATRKRGGFLFALGVVCVLLILFFAGKKFLWNRQGDAEQVLEVLPGHQVEQAVLDAIWEDGRVFPVVAMNGESSTSDWDFGDSWLMERTYGGQRLHEGTDIMLTENVRGIYPVISVSDGVVEKLGWLEKGGWRVGVRSEHGVYFYYAHLESYMPELAEGDSIHAGDVLGFAGDSGYGEEGTVGNFAVHLHFGIYVNDVDGVETAVNSYPVLVKLEEEAHQGKLWYCLSGSGSMDRTGREGL